jgi:hypothetical protein
MYARYSSEHQKESSIEDQFRNCEQYAARQGWTVTHRYEDKAISGSTAERPGYQRMLRLFVLIAMVLPVLTGCESYARQVGGTNPTIPDAKQGKDCRGFVFGIGGLPDVTCTQAMRSGGMTKLRSAEYRVNAFAGVGSDCVIAHGE